MTRKSIPVITFSVNILTMIEKTISHRGVHKKTLERESILQTLHYPLATISRQSSGLESFPLSVPKQPLGQFGQLSTRKDRRSRPA